MIMMIDINSWDNNDFWRNINLGSERYIANKNNHHLYLGVENNGDYALYIYLSSPQSVPIINIKNLEISLYNTMTPTSYVWVIILKSKKHLNIFKTLCYDLCSVANNAITENGLLKNIINRLRAWQELFSADYQILNLPKQMGLFSELLMLFKILKLEIPAKNVINAWVGSEGDKQDFIFDEVALEVKSYKSSRGNKITISSKEQLETNKSNLFLATFALNESLKGENIQNLVDAIYTFIDQDISTRILFEKKLLLYGYDYNINENELFQFVIDKSTFYKIVDPFPRILSKQIPAEIISLNYSIDLTTCQNYIISENELLSTIHKENLYND